MATPIDLLDPPAVMSYGGLVDASTAQGQVEEQPEWGDAIAAMLTIDNGASERVHTARRPGRATHLAHITGRRGAYSGR